MRIFVQFQQRVPVYHRFTTKGDLFKRYIVIPSTHSTYFIVKHVYGKEVFT